MKALFAEFVGTMVLVLFGVGAAVLAGDTVGQLGVALCFGIAVIAMAYTVGGISGAHLNPAVSTGMWVSGRMSCGQYVRYVVAQVAGATVGALLVWLIASGNAGFVLTTGLGQNGFGPGYAQEYSLMSALIFEVVATFVFVRIILEVTKTGSNHAGLAIGLTLAALLIVGMNITGGSLNPARSFGPAIIVGGTAIKQLWVFICAPLAGGLLAGVATKLCPLNGVAAATTPKKKK